MHNDYVQEQEEVLVKLKPLDEPTIDIQHKVESILSVARRAGELFEVGTDKEKRAIAKLVPSNPVFKGGTIEYHYKKPFDKFVNVVELEKWGG